MSNIKAEFSMDIIKTADGSPTLSLSGGEKMHSLDGAFSETQYIYGSTIKEVLSLPEPHILSMGLGLAYNEILSVALLLKANKQNYKITSFEIVDELKTSFYQWATSQAPTALDTCYSSILELISSEYDLNPLLLKEQIQKDLLEHRIELLGPLPSKNPNDFYYNAILYDAFSNHTDPDLWSEAHLDDFFTTYADPSHCFFSTYAATGNLKRALVDKNFTVNKRKGFGQKRESTFAFRKL